MPAPSFAEASAIKPLDSHTYMGNFPDDWCIGTVPHGGFVTSCFLRVASLHFSTTLRAQNQPHCIALHLEFPRRTGVGQAKFAVKDVKLGRATSTVHVSLVQGGREVVVGYITHSNIQKEEGVSFETRWELHPAPARWPAGAAELQRLKGEGESGEWVEQKGMPFQDFRKASQRVRFFFPRQGQPLRSISDEWLCFRDGSRFTNESLGFVADMFPQVVEAYREDEDPYLVKTGRASSEVVRREGREWAKYWYPTVVLNLDVKKALPAEGVEWLFVRMRAKVIRKGRLDIEVVIMDEGGEVVALSHHVTLVLSAGRNLAGREKVDPPKTESGKEERKESKL